MPGLFFNLPNPQSSSQQEPLFSGWELYVFQVYYMSKWLCECVAMERGRLGRLHNGRRGRQGERTSIVRMCGGELFADGYRVRPATERREVRSATEMVG